MRVVLTLAAVASLFLFPYPMTLVLSAMASLYVPWAGLSVGVLADLLYFVPLSPENPGISFPLASLTGALISLIALFVRRFVRERIIGG